MGTRYACQKELRRQAVRDHATLNGIDYLEVLHTEAPPDSPCQRTLLVRCLKTLPANIHDSKVLTVQITGGVRITPIQVEWVARAADAAALFAAGRISAAERGFFLSQPEMDHLLLVRTDVRGDYSTYTLHLVQSPTNPQPPDGFDPILSQVEFSFKVECPSDFDCRPQTVSAPQVQKEPAIDYLAKDYASFRQLLLDRLSVIMPGWRERNPADLGVALVELLAYAGDQLSCYQDAVANEAYLGTARQRVSVRRHARLLDYTLHEGCNARAWVCFEVDAGGDSLILPQRDALGQPTRLLTQLPERVVIEQHRLAEILSRCQPQVYELMHDLTLYQAHNEIRFYTWGDEECCLPKGATQATLRDDIASSAGAAARLRLRAGDVLIFQERLDPGTGQSADADPAHRHAVRLTRVCPEAKLEQDGRRTPGDLDTDPLFGQPIVKVEWDAADALPFPLCLSTRIGGELIPDVSIAYGNVALADHGCSIAETPERPAAEWRYRPPLRETGITYRVVYEGEERRQPAAMTLRQDPHHALPAMQLSGDGQAWTPQRHLLNSDRFAPEFVVEMESDGRAFLRFGDGVYGRRPPGDVQLQATYRIGNGSAGNVGTESITHVVTDFEGISRVWNPLPAQGGVDPEPLEQARLSAPQAFRIQERAVTEQDYAMLAQRHAEVQKAVATRRWTGSWHTIFVTVDRKGGRLVDAEFERDLRRFLERFRLAGHDLEVDGPRFVSLDIALTVCVSPGYLRSDVKQALLATFGNRELPGGRRGFFHPDNYTFGQPVYLSQVISAAMQTPGVQWVDADDTPPKRNRFQRWGEPPHDEIENGQIAIGRLEIARLDNDPSQPENGKIEFFMEGGL